MALSAENDSSSQFVLAPISDADRVAMGVAGFSPLSKELPTFDLSSDSPLPSIPDEESPPAPATPNRSTEPTKPIRSANGKFWIEGNALMCGCPDCGAPMTVRIWLLAADCWRCATSIELSDEEEREIQRMLKEREHTKSTAPTPPATSKSSNAVEPNGNGSARPDRNRRASRSHDSDEHSSPAATRSEPADGGGNLGIEVMPTKVVAPPLPDDAPPKLRVSPEEVESREDAKTDPRNREPDPRQDEGLEPTPGPMRTRVAPASRTRARKRMAEVAQSGTVIAQIRNLFKMTPAWLVSAVIHMIALTLMALFLLPPDDEDERLITLSTVADNETREGGTVQVVDPNDEAEFDLPIPTDVDIKDEEVRETYLQADQEARELRVDPDSPNTNLVPLTIVRERIGAEKSPRRTFAARDPRVRVEMVKHEGGTTLSEAAVARALKWLSIHQNDDGSWGLHDFNQKCGCKNRGGVRSHSGGTSLALLPFLGAGQTHLTGRYKHSVAKGIRWLIKHQRPDGDLRYKTASNAGMYVHGQAAIVLCEAFAMEGDEALRVPAQRAIDFIVGAQYTDGGWRYRPRNEHKGDTSVVGWQLMALQSARAAGLKVPDRTLFRAGQFLDSVEYQNKYRYMASGKAPTETMTAEALLCRMYLGWTRDRIEMREGIDWLINGYMPGRTRNIYYWYYATQTMHHFGGEQWEKWNVEMRDLLVRSQAKSGHQAGSWAPQDHHGNQGGRIFVTSLAACTLEVYYRHLPIFKQIDLDAREEEE